ncbi:hypothetical protein BrevBR_15465 [Brevundimonas sp. BR2-1]|uniref:type IV pilus modification PilV family protein n=1 Tax=Brevundimonas sp. BR2-1 TaxID=3031123 RepID=UPI0030A75650
MPCRRSRRRGYLTIDALVALSITVLAVSAAVGLAASAVTRLAQARDRLASVRIADDLYEELYAGERPDGQQSGTTDGRSWTYATSSAATPTVPSVARRTRITVDRRFGPDLVVDAVLPPVPAEATGPATASSN